MTQSLTKLPAERVGAAGAGSGHDRLSVRIPPRLADAPSATGAPVSFPWPQQKLMAAEALLYAALVQDIGRPFTEDELARTIHSYAEDVRGSLRVLICRLRRKLPRGVKIERVWKRGYVMERAA